MVFEVDHRLEAEERDQSHRWPKVFRESAGHERENVRTARVADQNHFLPPPLKLVMSDDALQGAGALIRRAARSEVIGSKESNHRDARGPQLIGDFAVDAAPSAVAGDHHGETVTRFRSRQLHQRKVADVEAWRAVEVGGKSPHSEDQNQNEDQASHCRCSRMMRASLS